MDVFNLSNLLVLGVVGVVLLIYRQLDRNNRSLDKIRKFADTVRADLQGFIDQRTQEIKDFAVELEVHQKTGKEIIKRIRTVEEELSAKAPDMESLKTRIDDYGQRIDGLFTLSRQVDENLGKLKEESEFVDKVGRRIKLAAEQIQEIEGRLPEIEKTFHEENSAALSSVLEDYRGFLAREQELLEKRQDEALDKTEEYRKYIDSLEERKQTFLGESQKQLAELLRLALEKNQGHLRTMEDHLQAKSRQFEQEWINAEKLFHKRIEDTSVQAEKFNTELLQKLTVKIQDQIKTSAAGWTASLQTAAKDVNAGVSDLRSVQDSLRREANELTNDLRSDMEETRRRFDDLEKAADASGEALLARVDARIAEQEKTFDYRLSGLESLRSDMDRLESNLRDALGKTETRISAELEEFEAQVRQRTAQESAAVAESFQKLRVEAAGLEKSLDELKAQAYGQMNEKLQVFENDFFSDLQKRSAQMTLSFDQWHGEIQKRLQVLGKESEAGVEELRTRFTGQLEDYRTQLQSLASQQAERLDSQIRGQQTKMEETLGQLRARLEETSSALSQEVAGMESSSLAKIEREIAAHEIQLKDALTRMDRETDGKLKGFNERIEAVQHQFAQTVQETESSLVVTQSRLVQKLKSAEEELEEQFTALKGHADLRVSEIKDEFAKQKEDLVQAAGQDRLGIKQELAHLRDTVDQLESDLSKRSEAALETFRRDYEGFSLDFQKKTKEQTLELDQRLREFRTVSQDTKDKAEALQKKLFGKIEDQYNLLSVNLEEIDKKQKSFMSQTKLFERADTLKLELQESIEDMKNDLAKLELQRKDVQELDSQVSRIRKMSDEITEKLAKFMAEKKRIDLLDSDFARVLSVSQSVDERLRQITENHDLLQEIQLRIRKLEDYEKDVETRFDRLEKKKALLDSTAEAVDRNYGMLEKMERSVKDLGGTLSTMPAEVDALKKRFKELATGRDEAQEALVHLKNLTTLLTDVEKRTEKMEQAREWLARTETRLQEVSQEAEEQVKLLGTLVKANPASAGKAKGAPAMDMRQTVVKLSHQGWSREEISRATKLSLGEVELILELGAR